MSQNTSILLAKAFTRWPALGRAWSKLARIEVSTDIPWAPMRKPLRECRVCLITTGGLHLKSDPPFDMKDTQGDPTFRLIPASVIAPDLTITHNYYNHADADRDFNILLPLDRMRELSTAGSIGGITPSHYSFMGHIDGPHVDALKNRVLPRLLEQIHAESPDLVLLTPA